MKELRFEQADGLLNILNEVTIPCSECPLTKPCNVFQKEEHNSICGILTEITAEYEEEQD